jgi:hypothetical protein
MPTVDDVNGDNAFGRKPGTEVYVGRGDVPQR